VSYSTGRTARRSFQGLEDPVKYSPNSGSGPDAHHWPFASHNNPNE